MLANMQYVYMQSYHLLIIDLTVVLLFLSNYNLYG